MPIVLALMRTMLPRAPACNFTKEDIDGLEVETGLKRKQIEQWEQNFRYRILEEHRQARLANPEKDDEKVKHTTAFRLASAFFARQLVAYFLKNLGLFAMLSSSLVPRKVLGKLGGGCFLQGTLLPY